MRILFVGDEAAFPTDLIELVSDMGPDWQVEVCPDASAAMVRAAAGPLDVVLSAPTLSDLPPATLLGQIRTLRPEASRIAVIESRGIPSARIIGLAHRFLPAPLAPEVVLEAVGSLEELRELLDNPALGQRIGRVEQLPPPPQLYLRLMSALEADDATSAADIARLVAADPAIAAKVLQLCNSAYFSSGRTITDLRTAVTRLGIATLRDLVLACEVFSLPGASTVDRAQLQQRALLASKLAKRMLPESCSELGATAALLADIGLLLPGVRDERHPRRRRRAPRPRRGRRLPAGPVGPAHADHRGGGLPPHARPFQHAQLLGHRRGARGHGPGRRRGAGRGLPGAHRRAAAPGRVARPGQRHARPGRPGRLNRRQGRAGDTRHGFAYPPSLRCPRPYRAGAARYG